MLPIDPPQTARRCGLLAAALFALTAASLPAAWAAGGSAYVANLNSSNVSQYAIGAGGALTTLTPPTIAAGSKPSWLVVSPDGNNVYATNVVSDNVSQYDVGAGGTLTAKTPAAVAAGTGPDGVAVSPDGSSVYVAMNNEVAQYDAGANGALTPKTPATVAGAAFPNGIAVSRDGRSVYVANASGGITVDGQLIQYDVGEGGTLTYKTPAVVGTGKAPYAVAVAPDGTSVYVTNVGSQDVSQFDVGANGALTAKTPATVSTGAGQPHGIALSPDGTSVYVATGNGEIAQYDVGANGVLTAKTPATVAAPMGSSPYDLAVSPNGNQVYATSQIADNVRQYDVGAGGSLTATSNNVATGMDPWAITLLPTQGPTAAFSATLAPAGSATAFNGSASSDSDGSIARYDWDFGDGSQALDGGSTPTHTYGAAGDYTATLTVTDDSGCSTSFVFTGQTASCTGGVKARTSKTLTIPSPDGGGGDGGGGGNGGGADVAPAAADLSSSPSSIRVNRRRRSRFPFDATADLTGKAVFKSVKRVRVSARRRVVLARKAFSVPANGHVKLKLRMSKKKFRILKRERRIRTRVTVTLVNAAGLTSTASKRVKLKAPG